MKNIAKLGIILSGLLFWTGCTDEKADYIILSNSSFTFDADGSEVFHVTIEAGSSWSAGYTNSWFTVEQQDNTLLIGATPTRSNSMRRAQITITSGHAEEVIDLSQLGTNVLFSKLEQNSQDFVMSPNGRYIGAVKVLLVDAIYYYTPYIIESKTGEITELATYTYMYDAAAIADNGVFALGDLTGSAVFFNENKELIAAKLPPNMERVVISNMSADGTIFVGYGRNTSNGLTYPIKWVNNEPELLAMPMTTPLGQDVSYGTMARGCSADGSVIYGSCWDDQTAVYWRNSGSWEYVGGTEAINVQQFIVEDYSGGYLQHTVADRPVLTAETTNISSSGQYLAVTYLVFSVQDRELTSHQYPALLDTRSGKLTILNQLPGSSTNGMGRTASDRGHFSFACATAVSWLGYVYDNNTGITRTISDYLNDEFGFMLQQQEAYIISYVGDGSAIMGGTYLYEGSDMEYWYMTVTD